MKIIKKIPKHTWILLAIMAIGIFLRTYNFHNWLIFSLDQARDAFIISDAIDGKNPLPLLGPVAGGTFFHLGPAYYQFSYISAKLFGNYPDKMAYPSLAFSILAIPLLFLFLKEYFSKNISLSLTAIMSVSYFFIEMSRYSSNPNLSPFFVLLFLYALLKILNNSSKKFFWLWPILAGISLGIGIQLHTTLLVVIPIFTLILFAYLIKKGGIAPLKYFLAILAISLAINSFQIISEFNTKWSNTRNFFDGLEKKGSEKGVLMKNAKTAFICQAKSNAYMIFSLPVIKECSRQANFNIKGDSKEIYGEIKNKNLRKAIYILNISFIFIFSVLGYILFISSYFKEKNKERKNFLKVVGLFYAIALIFFIPVIASSSVNYFVIIFFAPLILLGLILKFCLEKIGKYGIIISIFLVAIALIAAMQINLKAASSYEKRLNNNLDNSDLKWAEDISKIFMDNTSSRPVYLSGENKYLKRYARPISYLLSRRGIGVFAVDISSAEHTIPSGKEFIYVKNKRKGEIKNDKTMRGFPIINSERFDSVDIYFLKNNRSNK